MSGEAMKPRRCPKCRGFVSHFSEIWDGHSIEFDADESERPEAEGVLCEGSPVKVIAHCAECGHAWRLRGVVQITELRE